MATQSEQKIARRIARLHGVETAHATTNFSNVSCLAITEFNSEVLAVGYGRTWDVSVTRTNIVVGTDLEGLDIYGRSELIPASQPLVVVGTIDHAIAVGIGAGIGYAAASQDMENGN